MILEFSPGAVEEFVERYMVANTAAYLYRRLRKMDAAIELSRKYSVGELEEFVLEVDGNEKASLEDVAKGYAALVALTLKESETEVGSRSAWDRLKWVPEMLYMWKSRFQKESRLTLISRRGSMKERVVGDEKGMNLWRWNEEEK